MRFALVFALVSFVGVFAGGCTPTVVLKQEKPMEFNINITGQVEVVIKDARQNLEQITGEKPAQVVSPADIGLSLPPTTKPAQTSMLERMREQMGPRVVYLSDFARPLAASEEELKKAMAGRNSQVQGLWESGLVGESHDGLLVERGTLSAQQKQLVAAENADRTALYDAEAKRRSMKVGDVALSYYLARLGYAKNGAWYEVYSQAAGKWEWKQWPAK